MKWIWRLLGLVVGVAVLLVAALFLIPADRIAGIAAERFEAATGRALTIDGGVRPTLWPTLGVSLGKIEIANAGWAGDAPMIEAESISVGVDAMGLVAGDVRVTGFEMNRPVIRLATSADGTGNWVLGSPGEASAEGQAAADTGGIGSISVDRATVSDGTLIYTGSDGAETRIDGISLTASVPDLNGPADVAITASFGGDPVTVSMYADRAAGLLTATPAPLSATLEAAGATASFQGDLMAAPTVVMGRIEADIPEPAAFFTALGQAAPDLPAGLGRDAIGLSAVLDFHDGTVSFSDLDLKLDGNAVTGTARVALGGARPRIDATLRLGEFDLSSAPTADNSGGGSGSTTGWSTDPIDLSALGLVDGTFAVTATRLDLGTSRIGALTLVTTIENARAVTEIRQLVAYGGTVAGTLVLNARNTFSTRLAVAGSALAISRLLSELVGFDRLIAAGDLELDVLGVGGNLDAVMNSLDGKGAFRIGTGELLGLDIVGILTHLDPSYMGQGRSTIFDSITGTFTIEDGVLIYNDLSVLAPLFRASGTGIVGIGGQTLDLSIVPELLGGENAGIRVPLRVSGTWSNPRVGLDLDAALRERVEQEVRDKIEDEIGKKLGTEGGQSIEKGVEDAIKKGLGGLFNR